MKKIRAAACIATLAAGFVIAAGTPAQAANDGNCQTYGKNNCFQRVTVNTVSRRSTITLAYATGGNFYVGRATTGLFLCGNSAGISRIYVHSGYDIRIKGYFGVNEKERTIVNVYYQSTGWHTLPANFRSPRCAYDEPFWGYKYGNIFDVYEYKQ